MPWASSAPLVLQDTDICLLFRWCRGRIWSCADAVFTVPGGFTGAQTFARGSATEHHSGHRQPTTHCLRHSYPQRSRQDSLQVQAVPWGQIVGSSSLQDYFSKIFNNNAAFKGLLFEQRSSLPHRYCLKQWNGVWHLVCNYDTSPNMCPAL